MEHSYTGMRRRRTRRPTLEIFALIIVLTYGALWLSERLAVARTTARLPAREILATISAGDSVWKTAAGSAPGADPRRVVYMSRRVGRLGDVDAHPGDRIVVPSRDTATPHEATPWFVALGAAP